MGSLGLDLSYRASSMSVVIKEVYEDGEVARWNRQQSSPEDRIRANDHIVAVNGKGGTSKFLVTAINESQRLDLLVTRPVGEWSSRPAWRADCRSVHPAPRDSQFSADGPKRSPQ